jgi:hypothetical protein
VKKYLSAQPRPMNTVKTYGADGGIHGNIKDGIERWWRHFLGGAASDRFHRPPSGLGLSELSVNCLKVARDIEKTVNFWDLTPGNELLSERDENEAYLASKQGKTYVMFLTDGGEAELDLRDVQKDFKVKWYNIRKGKIVVEDEIAGGKKVNIKAPGELEWIALIYSK